MDGTLPAPELLRMSPHKQDPASWEIEIDLSEILIRPDAVERQEVQSGNALLERTDWSLDVGDRGISLLGWANISFAVSCVIGLICTFSIFDTSDSSGEGHIHRMRLSVRGWNLIRHDHNVALWNLLPGLSRVAYSKQSPTPSTVGPPGEDQTPALSPGIVGVAERTSTNASSPLRSDTVALEWESPTTASSAENASTNQETTSEHSSRSALTCSARKPIITSRTNALSGWEKFERSWNRGLRKLRAANSTSRTKRHTVSSAKSTRRLGPKFRS